MGLFDRRATKPKTRALTAAGARVVPDTAPTTSSAVDRGKLQADAWRFRGLVPELRFVGGFVATQMSRVRWYVAEAGPDGAEPRPLTGEPPEPDDDHTPLVSVETAKVAMDALERLDLNSRGSSMAGRVGENFEYAGECYLLGEEDPKTGQERWSIRSVREIRYSKDKEPCGVCGKRHFNASLVEPGANTNATGRKLALCQVELFRLWVPDPEYHQWADSKITACLGVLDEIVTYDAQARAAAKSRISSGAILFVPEEFSLSRPGSAPVDIATDGAEDDEDLAMAELTSAMLTPISSHSDPSAVVPIIVRGPATVDGQPMKDLIGVVQIPREEIADAIKKREAAVVKLAHGMDVPPEIITGITDANHWCVDDQTEILSQRGWLRHEQLAVGDIVLTLNHDTGLSEWQPVRDIYRAPVVDEPMVSMETRTHSSVTTRGHRWPVLHHRGGKNQNIDGSWVDGRHWAREWRTSEQLGVLDRLPSTAGCADLPMVAKWEDDLVELLAWYWTEGHARAAGITIAQSHTRNPERVARIRAALTRLYGPASTTLRGGTLPRWRENVQQNTSSHGGPITVFSLCRYAAKQLREIAPNKLVSREFIRELTPAQLELFIDISAQGDGWHYRASGCLDMWQRQPAMLEAYELALVLSGRMVSRGTSDGGHWVRPLKQDTVNPAKSHNLALKQDRAPQVTEQAYTGVVWCPTTDNRTWFARRRGTTYFTGNSAYQVSDDTVRNHLEPRCELLADSLTESYLRESCLAQDCPPEEVARLCVWFDASELAQPADPMGIAKDLHDRDVINDAALRRAGGYGDDDAPTDAERLMKMLAGGQVYEASIPIVVALSGMDLQDPKIAAALRLAREATAVQRSGQPGQPGPRVIDQPQASPEKPVPDRALPQTAQNLTDPAGPRVAVTAASKPSPAAPMFRVDERACADLAAIDAEVLAELGGYFDAQVQRAVEKAAGRIRSKATRGGRPEEAALFASSRRGADTVDPVTVVAAAGPRFPWSITDQVALEGAMDRAHAKWRAVIARAAREVARRLRTLLGRDPGKDVVAEMTRRAEQAWPALAAALERATTDLLHGAAELPDTATATEVGVGRARDAADVLAEQLDEAGPIVPRTVIVEALTEVGGTPADTAGASDTNQPATGLSAGTLVRDEIVDAGAVELGMIWRYKGIERHPFPPHLDLSGARLTGFDDPQLKPPAGYEWVGDHLHPGDHRGCLCSTELIVAAPNRPDGSPATLLPDELWTEQETDRQRQTRELAEADDRAGRTGTHAQRKRDQTAEVHRLRREHITDRNPAVQGARA